MERAPMTTRLLVKDVMNSPAVTAEKNTSIKELARLMADGKVGSVVITDNEKPVGIVSDWDIVVKAIGSDKHPRDIKAEEIMEKFVSIDSNESITAAAKLFRKHGIKRLVVLYKGKVVGVISASDVIAVMPELIDVVSEKANIIRGEIGRSVSFVSGYCDECEEWSDYLQYVDGKFLCENCREVRG